MGEHVKVTYKYDMNRRSDSLLVAKSSSYGPIEAATQTIINVINEVTAHKAFCAKWGITEEELAATQESPATMAYGAYLLDIGLQGEPDLWDHRAGVDRLYFFR